jgi:hypothetical protein
MRITLSINSGHSIELTYDQAASVMYELDHKPAFAGFFAETAKGAFLKAFGADIFFDDQKTHCDSAREHVPTGHVPHGIANE